MNTFKFPDYANRWDVAIVTALLTDALSMGWLVDVNDGEETTVRKSGDSSVITAAMMSTDMDTLTFWVEGKYIGSMLLVWGNSGECYADGTMDNGGPFDLFCDRVVESINNLFGTRN